MHGVYFDGRTAKAHEATANAELDAFVVRLAADDGERRFAWRDVVIEPPMGRVRRAFVLAGSQRFETSDFAAVAALEERLGRNRGQSFVHRLESRWRLVLASVVVFVVAAAGIWQFGLPVLASVAASLTPPGAMAVMDRQASRLLDDQLFEPTKLPAATRARLTADFERVVARLGGGGYEYRLQFRDGDELGANALALPHGTIYVTDQLVKLAKDDREIEGVLAHEVGHVVRRHAVKGVYQSVGLFVLLSAVMGDVGTASTIAATIPAVLVRSGYSRDMERDADDVAGRYLLERYGTTRPLQTLLARLTESHGAASSEFSILDSHPGLERRLAHLRDLQRDAQRQP